MIFTDEEIERALEPMGDCEAGCLYAVITVLLVYQFCSFLVS